MFMNYLKRYNMNSLRKFQEKLVCVITRPYFREKIDYSNIYCTGPVLEDVQNARIFNDSKSFVDMKLRHTEDVINEKYRELRESYTGPIPHEMIHRFVEDNFEEGQELEEWTPSDFKERPSLVDKVSDPAYKSWVIALNYVFKSLSRKVKDEVRYKPHLYSILWVPYGEDVLTASKFKDAEEKHLMYNRLRAAAETGFDFSTRWFINKDGTNQGELCDTDAPNIVPIDLNCFLHANAMTLSNFFTLIGNFEKQELYSGKANSLLEGINAVLWDNDEKFWFDYDLKNANLRKYFYHSNFTPLWTRSFPDISNQELSKFALEYIRKNNIGHYTGGVPMSLERSKEQWDFPNVWPPLQGIIIEGLLNINTPECRQKAFEFADRWVRANYRGYKKYGNMFEKYDALTPGKSGAGGEYEAQSGFGWTNGVILQLLDKFADELKSEDEYNIEYDHSQATS